MEFIFEKPKDPTPESLLHPIDIAEQTQALLDSYTQIYYGILADIRKYKQERIFAPEKSDSEIMKNPSEDINSNILTKEDLTKKIEALEAQKEKLSEFLIQDLHSKIKDLKKQLSIDPELN